MTQQDSLWLAAVGALGTALAALLGPRVFPGLLRVIVESQRLGSSELQRVREQLQREIEQNRAEDREDKRLLQVQLVECQEGRVMVMIELGEIREENAMLKTELYALRGEVARLRQFVERLIHGGGV